MKNLPLLLLFLIKSLFVFSQKDLAPNRAVNQNSFTSIYSDGGFDRGFDKQGGVHKFRSSDDNSTEGSKFLFDNFNNISTITDKDQKKYSIKNINIDLQGYDFVSEISKDSLFYFKNISNVKIGNSFFERIGDKIYQTIIRSKKVSLYKLASVTFRGEVVDKLSQQVIKPKRWIKYEKLLYTINQGSSFNELKLSKKHILSIFNDKEAKLIKNYVKTEGLSYKDEKDVIKLLKYYNTL